VVNIVGEAAWRRCSPPTCSPDYYELLRSRAALRDLFQKADRKEVPQRSMQG